ncbi:hypothetical protein Tco_0469449 [Tanacetum coccineum]
MASLHYRLNPLFTFKECSFCGSLYNEECCCSNMSSVGKFVHDSNKAPDSPPHPHKFSSNQRHCFHCKDELGDGEFCQRCTCKKCGSGLSKGFCFICASSNENSSIDDSNPNSFIDSPKVFNPPPQPLIHSIKSMNDNPNFDDTPQEQNGIFYQRCTCESCGNGAHYGYNCPPKVPTISNPEPCNNQTVDELPQTLPSFHPTCYSGDENSFTYDSNLNFVDDSPNHLHNPRQFRKRQPAANIDQLPPQDMEDLKQQYLDEMKSLINEVQIKDYRNEMIDIQYRRECEIKIDELKQNFNGMSIEIRKKEKELMQQEQAAYVRTSQRFNFIDDDDDDEYSFATQEYLKKFSSAITPDLPKLDSLIMEDKHLDTIPATESDELIKSCVEDLVHTPSESDGISESEYDLSICDDSSPKKDEVLDDIISIPLGNGNDHFNAESSLIESVLNHDNVISSPKIDFLLEEFAGELAPIAPIPPGIVEVDLDPKGDIRFIENLMYDNSFPHPSETLKDDSETLVTLEEVKDFHPKDGEIEDDILREKLLKINLLIAKIETLNANPTPSSDFLLKSPIPVEDCDSFLEKFETTPELETFKFDIKEKNSGSTTIHADISLPDLECFYFKSKPDPGELTSIVDSGIRENVSSTTNVNLPFEDDQSPLFAYVRGGEFDRTDSTVNLEESVDRVYLRERQMRVVSQWRFVRFRQVSGGASSSVKMEMTQRHGVYRDTEISLMRWIVQVWVSYWAAPCEWGSSFCTQKVDGLDCSGGEQGDDDNRTRSRRMSVKKKKSKSKHPQDTN